MSVSIPYHRIHRKVKDGFNSAYSNWAYLADPEYAKNPIHYIRAYLLIQKDLELLFEFIEPSQEALGAYSYRIHELLMRTCIEVEANFKAILSENIYTPQIDRYGNEVLNIGIYKKIDKTHHLSSFRVLLPIWNGPERFVEPFAEWKAGGSLAWYRAYNESKHNRHEAFKRANFEMLLDAVAALLTVLSAQFQTHTFSSGPWAITVEENYYLGTQAAIGSLFRIVFPSDWSEDEIYDFNWTELSKTKDKFQKFDYNAI